MTMTEKTLTLKQVQERYRELSPPKETVKAYNDPFIKLGDVVPVLWRLETFGSQLRMTHEEIQKQVHPLLGACLLYLVAYCNAKQISLTHLVDEAFNTLGEKEKGGR
jgi:hypothetical protein